MYMKSQRKALKTAPEEVLICTLGRQPQVITFALDQLLAQGRHIGATVVVYSGRKGIPEAKARLEEEIHKSYPGMDFRAIPVAHHDYIVEDFITDRDINALLHTLYAVVREHRQRDLPINLLISSGRKVMGIMAMVVAQLLYGPRDRLWYVVTEGWSPGNEGHFHPLTTERVWLLRVPVMRWNESASLMRTVVELGDPELILQWQEKMENSHRMQRRREFVEHWLRPSLREVAELACQGHDNASIAEILHKRQQTVANQLSEVYDQMRVWLDDDGLPVERPRLIAELAPYFALKSAGD